MNGLNHGLSGLAAYGGALLTGVHLGHPLPDRRVLVLGAAVAVGAAVIADVDERSSRAARSVWPFGWLLRVVTGAHRTRTHWPLVVVPLLALWVAVLPRFTSRWPLAVTCGVLIGAGWPFATQFVLPSAARRVAALISVPIGVAVARWLHGTDIDPGWWSFAAVPVPYLVHLVGDTPTPAGVAWAAPFSKRPMSANLFRSGGWIEVALVTPMLFALVGWVGWQVLAVAR